MKRTIICLTAILLIILSIPNSISIDTSKIIYVDDDNTAGPWDGSIEHPYQKIQDAVDNAKNGDTVFVLKGIYITTLVYKEIKIIGESKGETIIGNDGVSYSSIYINSDHVTINNFTIINSIYGISIVDCSYNIISNTIIKLNDIGISIYQSNENIIINNKITNVNQCGIAISACNNNKINNNEISNITNGYGISIYEIYNSSFRNNNLINNKCGFRINTEKSRPKFEDQNDIINNNFINNLNYVQIISGSESIFYSKFYHNYWGRPRLLPKIIWFTDDEGNTIPILCNIDWYPAKYPFETK